MQEKSPHVVVKIPIGFGPKLHSSDSETYGFSPQTIGSVLHVSFQITPLYPHGSSIFCWLNPPIWMVDINRNKQCYPGRAQFMDDWADQSTRALRCFEHYHILPKIGASRFQKQNPLFNSISLNHSMDWFKGKSTGNHGFYHQI